MCGLGGKRARKGEWERCKKRERQATYVLLKITGGLYRARCEFSTQCVQQRKLEKAAEANCMPVMCAGCSGCFANINSFNPCRMPVRWLALSSFHKWSREVKKGVWESSVIGDLWGVICTKLTRVKLGCSWPPTRQFWSSSGSRTQKRLYLLRALCTHAPAHQFTCGTPSSSEDSERRLLQPPLYRWKDKGSERCLRQVVRVLSKESSLCLVPLVWAAKSHFQKPSFLSLVFFFLFQETTWKLCCPWRRVFQVSSHSRSICDWGYFKSEWARQGNLEGSQFPDLCLPGDGGGQ